MAEPLIEGGSGVSWPPPGLPHDARVFQLKNNSKRPPPGYAGGHHRATPWQQALLVPGPAACYGISLDGQYLLADFDVDCPEAQAMLASLPETWRQQTRRGAHLLYRSPPGFAGKRCAWVVNGVKIGDLLPNGFLVGPGSTVDGHIYILVDGRDPAPAPLALLEYSLTAEALTETAPAQYDQIPYQQRDHIMHKLGGLLRRHGVSERGIYEAFTAIRKSPAMEQPFGFEWTDASAKRNAHSAAQYAPEPVLGTLVPESVQLARDASLVGLPKRWWMHGFVARNALHLLYGDGECGKSTFGSHLYASVTAQGGRALFIGTEEPWESFGRRAVNGGGNRDLMYYLDRSLAARISFPKYAEDLAYIVAVLGIDFVYFDSIMTHTDPNDRGSAPERDRRMLASLSAIDTTIFGIFHERRGDGEWSGSNERKNVPRILLHAQRENDAPMDLMVKKSNLRPKPKYVATFVGHEKLAVDPEDGTQQFEEDETGKLVPSFDLIVERGPDKPLGKKGTGRSIKVTGSIPLVDVD